MSEDQFTPVVQATRVLIVIAKMITPTMPVIRNTAEQIYQISRQNVSSSKAGLSPDLYRKRRIDTSS